MVDEAKGSAFDGPHETRHAVRAGNAPRADVGALLMAGRWQQVALAAVLLLAAVLDCYHLDRLGYANTYYAAAVRSMLQSWHNLFFVSFDPGGFVTVDKPPLGFWIQTASAKIFGFHGWSILLPQAVAGVLSVAVLFILVRRVWGLLAGLLGALALALTPVAVVTNRNNTIDSLLVLVLLLAAWAVSAAADSGRLRWLLLAAGLIGLGFNIKMLQAYLVLPAFYLLYFVAAPHPWPKRMWHLAAATVLLGVVSLTWAVAVDLTPPDQRPYVGSSQHNSEIELAIGYNGVDRLLPGGIFRNLRPPGPPGSASAVRGPAGGLEQPSAFPGQTPGPAGSADAAVPPAGFPGGPLPGGGPFGGEIGVAGPLRLFQQQLAGQASWLLPLAAVGLLAASWRRPRRRLDSRQQSLLLWGTWLLTVVVFFSVASFFHRYYLIMLAPPVAALVGAGLVSMWHDYRRPGWKGWLLPFALVGTAAVQAVILTDYPNYSHWVTPLLAAACGVGAVLLALVRQLRRPVPAALALAAATIALVALLVAPSLWSAVSVGQRDGGLLPSAGPAQNPFPFPGPGEARRPAGSATGLDSGAGGLTGLPPGFGPGVGGPAGPPPGFGLGAGDETDTQLLRYLQQRRAERFLVAVPSSMMASSIILETGEPVMAMGGFTGTDPILTADELAQDVRNGTVRFFLMPGRPGQGAGLVNGDSARPFPSIAFGPSGNSSPPGPFPPGFFSGTPEGAASLPSQPTGQLPPVADSAPSFATAAAQQGPSALPFPGPFGAQDGLQSWVSAHCSSVPANDWQSTARPSVTLGFAFAEQLYDCAGSQ